MNQDMINELNIIVDKLEQEYREEAMRKIDVLRQFKRNIREKGSANKTGDKE